MDRSFGRHSIRIVRVRIQYRRSTVGYRRLSQSIMNYYRQIQKIGVSSNMGPLC